eukprot:4095837-Prymnesium_polylepis.2
MKASDELRTRWQLAGAHAKSRAALSQVLRVRPANTLLDGPDELELEHRPDALTAVHRARGRGGCVGEGMCGLRV